MIFEYKCRMQAAMQKKTLFIGFADVTGLTSMNVIFF